jgi:hypothetical protein
MRNQLMLAGAIALAAATDAGTKAYGKQTETPPVNQAETKALEPFTFESLTKENAKEIATALWTRVKAKDKDGKDSDKFDDRNDVAQEFMTALRAERDASKNTRPKRELSEILKEAVGKSLGELQAVKVPIAGVVINLPQVIKLATAVDENGKPKESPLRGEAVKFLKDNGLTVKSEKKGSRGRETTTLIEGDITKLAA